jgi:hypothetical protein
LDARVIVQRLCAHVPVQGAPQAPQLFGSLVVSTHDPLQLVWPGVVHVGAHDVPLQLTEPPVGAVQTVQLGPQALTSLALQVPEQLRVVAVHVQVAEPADPVQVWLAPEHAAAVP